MPLGYVLLLGIGALLLFSKKSEAKASPSPKPEEPKPEAPKPEEPKPEAPKPETPKPEEPKPEAPKDEPNIVRAPDDWLKKGLAQADLARVRYKRADGKLHVYEVTTPLAMGKVCGAIELLNAVEAGSYFDAECNKVQSDAPLEVLLNDSTSIAIVRPKGEPIGKKRTDAGKWFIITSTGENRI